MRYKNTRSPNLSEKIIAPDVNYLLTNLLDTLHVTIYYKETIHLYYFPLFYLFHFPVVWKRGRV